MMATNIAALGSRGRLRSVLTTRGTRGPAEAPLVIEHREALMYMLCQASEIEHAIMCQYLYAAFSLKQSVDEGLTAAQLTAVEAWHKTLSHVATQEMLHLALVQNLLSSIGGAPHLSRPNLPAPAGHYPPGVMLTLLPFGEVALRHFMYLERPEGMPLDDSAGQSAFNRAQAVVEAGDIVPRLQDFATIGHLYRAIEEGFRHLYDKFGPQRLFCGPARAQATTANFGWSELVAVVDMQSAQQAIDTIIEQGEGPRGDWQAAHFGQFVGILDEYLDMRSEDPSFEPARPVFPANVRPTERGAPVALIADPTTARTTDLFNVSYEVLLQILQRYFAHTGESDAELTVLADAAVNLMFEAIKPLGELVTRLPVGDEHPGMTAGPSFELFYESDYVLPHQRAAWLLMEERLRETQSLCERIEADAPRLAAALTPVAASLEKLANTLAAHAADTD